MNQINLLPIGYEKRYRHKWYVFLGVLVSILFCITLVTLVLIPFFKIDVAEKKRENLITALSNRQIMETREILNKIKEAENRKYLAFDLLDDLDIPTHITRQTMDVLVGNVPKGLRMNKILMEKNNHNIIIGGYTHSITNVAQYIVQLYNTGQFDIIEYTVNPNEDSKVIDWTEYSIIIKPTNIIRDEETGQYEAEDIIEEEGL